MPCSADFIEFVCEMLSPLGEVRSRKMMGDYVIFCNFNEMDVRYKG
ncbi:MAG: transcriptional regulator [Bacteroidales bacterium]|nr:transcriptional regulator [Bacteroidales bacterium]